MGFLRLFLPFLTVFVKTLITRDTACVGCLITYIKNFSLKGFKMPKLKTKSSVKKRFRLTGTGKIVMAQAGKRHGMIKRTCKFIRNNRGTTIMAAVDEPRIKRLMPYGVN